MTDQPRARWAEWRWLAAGGGLGFTAALAQVLLLRELLVGFRGNELSLGISLSAWLLWVALGSAVGGRLSRERRDSAAPETGVCGVAAAVSLVLLGLLSVAGIWFARDLRAIFGVGWAEFIPISRLVSATVILVAPVGLAAGVAFPLLCRAAQMHARVAPRRVYLAESVGFLLGGAASFASADHVPPFTAALAVGFAAAVAAVLAAWDSRAWRVLPLTWAVALSAAAVARVPAGLEAASLRNLYPEQRIIAHEYSRYGSWAALAHAEQVAFYHNGALAFSAPQPIVAETLAHLALLQHPDPRRVLLIGDGVDGTAAEILKHPQARLDYVELDPAVITVAGDCPQLDTADLLAHPRLRFFRRDGRLFVKRSRNRYDVIIVNLPEPATALLNRFYTVEFFTEARRAMTAGGVLCLGLPSGENYIGPEMQALHGSVYHPLRLVFPDVVVTPGDHSYFFASLRRGVVTADAEALAARWEERAVPARYFDRYYIEALLLPERVDFVTQSCRSAPRAINRDFRPVGYFHDVAVSGLTEGLLPPGAAARIRALPLPLLVAVGLALFGVPFAFARRGQRLRRAAIVGGIAAVGLAGMTLEVCLLFAFQIMNGHVYAQVGALVAVFMGGLALGTWTESRALARGARAEPRWLAWLIAGAVVTAATPPALAALEASPAAGAVLSATAIAALMAAGGAVVGALFPLAVHLLGGSAGAAGTVYAGDLCGAALGAFITAVVALPLLGLPGTCYAAAVMVGAIAAVGMAALPLRHAS
ncbi:MAG: hypothetical protein JSV65_13545 [Armatimonadota bacterium]|nr:MAG: hypothetical protein JSV65_13545 [Armatimonadota bacterium]